ncbi:Hypothetical_protein [Hexamita inflata]|uniref:Hypothetical_protein n=1 Tax=Hexamita inflata TaxID=28002 RepID=A0AA86QXJ8_9EUKA|nr:Hypothetical protein HINF_LOCUS53638 [Hexamita inflata]
MVEVVFENFVNYLRSGNTDKLNIISFQQNQQHKINLSTQLIFYRILTKTVVQLIRIEAEINLKNRNFENLVDYGELPSILCFLISIDGCSQCQTPLLVQKTQRSIIFQKQQQNDLSYEDESILSNHRQSILYVQLLHIQYGDEFLLSQQT